MENIQKYTFTQDNVFNNLEGGLGYQNIYNLIHDSIEIRVKEKKEKNYYDAKERERTCTKDKSTNKLRCDSGKLLKYFIRIEISGYNKALNKAKKKGTSPPDKEKYLRIIRPYNKREQEEAIITKVAEATARKSRVGEQVDKIIRDREKLASDKGTAKKAAEVKAAEAKAAAEAAKKASQAKKEGMNVKTDAKSLLKAAAASAPAIGGAPFLKTKEQKLEEQKEKAIAKITKQEIRDTVQKYKIDVVYIQQFFKSIRELLTTLVKELESCEYLVNIDQTSLGKIFAESIKKKENDPNLVDPQKGEKGKLQKIKDWSVEKFDDATKNMTPAEKKLYTAGAVALLGVAVVGGWVAAGLGFTPFGLACVAMVAMITCAIYSCITAYKIFKFGAGVVPKDIFIRNLYMFALNTKDNTKPVSEPVDLKSKNPYNEDSILNELENDLTEYLKKLPKAPDNGVETSPEQTNLRIINVNNLCFTSVQKDCPDELTGMKGQYKYMPFGDKDRKKYREQRNLKKQITKGIFKRMGKAFNEISKDIPENVEKAYVDTMLGDNTDNGNVDNVVFAGVAADDASGSDEDPYA